MTHATNCAPRRGSVPAGVPAAAVAVALLLAGCSTGHIGESWQCPLAEGGSCDSVAAADPAAPKADAAQTTVLTEPLWRVRDAGRVEAPEPPPCAAGCGAGFDPFAWLMGLFEGGDGDGQKTAAPGPVGRVPPEAPAAALPAEPEAAGIHSGDEDRPAADLRTGEIVARIWIAPFVDADGVYREASHVRVVLEPAGWRVE